MTEDRYVRVRIPAHLEDVLDAVAYLEGSRRSAVLTEAVTEFLTEQATDVLVSKSVRLRRRYQAEKLGLRVIDGGENVSSAPRARPG